MNNDAADFRIQNITKARLNGRMVKIFKAYRNSGTHFEYIGQFSAPVRTADSSLWKIAADA